MYTPYNGYKLEVYKIRWKKQNKTKPKKQPPQKKRNIDKLEL